MSKIKVLCSSSKVHFPENKQVQITSKLDTSKYNFAIEDDILELPHCTIIFTEESNPGFSYHNSSISSYRDFIPLVKRGFSFFYSPVIFEGSGNGLQTDYISDIMYTNGTNTFGNIPNYRDNGNVYKTSKDVIDNLMKFISPYCILLDEDEVKSIVVGSEWISEYHSIGKFNALARKLIKLKLPTRDKEYIGNTLYRGMVIKKEAKKKLIEGESIALMDRVATSWTTNKEIARVHIKRHLELISGGSLKNNAIIIKNTKVKPKDVVISFSGISLIGNILETDESEVVLYGNGGLDSITKKDIVSR